MAAPVQDNTSIATDFNSAVFEPLVKEGMDLPT